MNQEKLAIDGGKPVRTKPLPLEFPGMHHMDAKEIQAAVRLLRARSPFRYYGIKLQKEVEKLEAAAKAYGKEGEETGVTVGFGSLTGDAAGGVTVSADEAGNLSFAVTFDMSKISGGDAFAIDTGHEGTHVADIRNPLYADPRTTLSDFQREFRGYETSVWVARSLGFATLSYGRVQVWNRSWSKVDQRDAAITRYLTTREQNPLPETRPHNPWPD